MSANGPHGKRSNSPIEHPTVAILGASGALGSELVKELAPLADSGGIKLVILHRESSKVRVPPNAEGRVLDLGHSTDDELKAALDGVDILINTTNNTTPDASTVFHTQLVEHAKLQIYVPADFTLDYAHEAPEAPNDILASLITLVDYARTLGLPVTSIHNGVYEHWLFRAEATGIDVKTNTLRVYDGALDNKLPVTSLAYLAKAVREIVLDEGPSAEQREADEGTRDKRQEDRAGVRVADVAGKNFTVVEYEATGNEIGAAIEAVSHIKPKIIPLTDSEVEGAEACGAEDAINVGICKAWGVRGFPPGESIEFEPRGVSKRTLDDAVREALCVDSVDPALS